MRRLGEPGSYGWAVVGVSTAVNALTWGARSTFALFYVAILGDFAWGRGPTALGYSLSWLCFILFAPLAGWLYDRTGTYALALWLAVAALALSSLAVACTPHPHDPEHPLRPDQGEASLAPTR